MNFLVRPLGAINIEQAISQFIGYAYSHFGDEIYKDDIIDLDYIIEAVYMLTGYRFLPKESLPAYCEGLTSFTDGIFSISEKDWDSIESNNRARFSIAHEISHVLLHREQADSFDMMVARNIERKLPSYRTSEWQANLGAAALLMPYGRFSKALHETCMLSKDEKTIIRYLSIRFGASKDSVERRVKAVIGYEADMEKRKKLTELEPIRTSSDK